MYNSRTPSPLEYQFPNNINPNNFYGQSSLTKVIVRPPTGKLILFDSILHDMIDNFLNNILVN